MKVSTSFVLLLILSLATLIKTELAITREAAAELKRRVKWEVTSYEKNIFRGWSVDEVKTMMGLVVPHGAHIASEGQSQIFAATAQAGTTLASSQDWSTSSCMHAPRNQGTCGGCWAFAAAGMLSDRCCLAGTDNGWLSPQELITCDKRDLGCNGGSPQYALSYIYSAGGLVREACYPYLSKAESKCPTTCKGKKTTWKSAHVCSCPGGFTSCNTVTGLKTCLASGPAIVGFGVCQSFLNYASGIYKCDCKGKYIGLHAVEAVGYNDTPECHFIVKNSWGTNWGIGGYFKIGCTECGIDGAYAGANVACLTVKP